MKLNYRPEIDGLRAIAVFFVILYHAQITIFDYKLFEGGFIGVDIFFVISGYLITFVILSELNVTGTFSFKRFYERRARRILPALLLVIFISLPFAWIYLLPISLLDFSKSILFSLGFTSNYYFHYSGQEYGAESSLLKPLLHTWSLSVEEQFYILFPVFMILSFRYFRKFLIYILFFGLLTSLFLANWGSQNHSSFTFYALPTRAWEILSGSIICYFEMKYKKLNKFILFQQIFSIFGLFLIISSIFIFQKDIFHPSFYTLIPISGVCLIIWFSNEKLVVTKILSCKLFTSIGLISYSLYLWHYPIFAFSRISNFTNGTFINQIILVILLITFSILSFYLIEKPVRNKKKIPFKIITTIFFLILIIFSLIVIKNNGLANRFPKIIKGLAQSKETYNLLKNEKKELCFGNNLPCYFNTSSNNKIVVLGDSIIGSLMFDLKLRAKKENYSLMTLASCLPFIGFDLVEKKTRKINHNCNNKNFLNSYKILQDQKNSIIIIGGRFPLHLSGYLFDNEEGGIEGGVWDSEYISTGKYKNLSNSFKDLVNSLSKENKIILLYPLPEVGWNVPKEFLKRFDLKTKNLEKIYKSGDFITTSYEVFKKRSELSFKLLDEINGNNIYRVYPHNIFCNNLIKDRCITHDKDSVYYSDDRHPSIEGAKIINDLIIKKIRTLNY